MSSGRSVRAGAVVPRLLLVVVLALGVFVMHTLGHPDGESSGPGMSHSVAHRAPGDTPLAPHGGVTAVTGSKPHQAAPAPSAGAAPAPFARAGHAPAAPTTAPREPMTGMDMASLCVAVLGVWVLGALLRAVLARRGGPPPRLPGAAVTVVRPVPPSPWPDLIALSVLRI
ncbi:hypothetical protein PH213_33060 [Streptomyces sp. SRF1]|uniref:hypothetical protein n=1 Tax=Streptomyces sp. SRF1 TaxID=1549642 RepID=UPI0025AF41A0|nr:hypothetical protein [Streptomyces sp. SRF1]MDN3059279.1 hypothetical protein [Streptomyces sp. SRF1]